MMSTHTQPSDLAKETDAFLDIQIRVNVLATLIKQHQLCAEDLHCQNKQHKNVLLALLLESVKF